MGWVSKINIQLFGVHNMHTSDCNEEIASWLTYMYILIHGSYDNEENMFSKNFLLSMITGESLIFIWVKYARALFSVVEFEYWHEVNVPRERDGIIWYFKVFYYFEIFKWDNEFWNQFTLKKSRLILV